MFLRGDHFARVLAWQSVVLDQSQFAAPLFSSRYNRENKSGYFSSFEDADKVENIAGAGRGERFTVNP